MSQFKKMQTDIKNQGKVKWKHVMHLIRLLISGVTLLREGYVVVDVGPQREQLLAIKRGEVSWDETEKWRKSLHKEFERALEQTRLPARPDYETANNYLIKARRLATQEALP
ncbi:MAG: nucleotidyltransferase domain-containing protein, partial [Gimesia chilikensis]